MESLPAPPLRLEGSAVDWMIVSLAPPVSTAIDLTAASAQLAALPVAGQLASPLIVIARLREVLPLSTTVTRVPSGDTAKPTLLLLVATVSVYVRTPFASLSELAPAADGRARTRKMARRIGRIAAKSPQNGDGCGRHILEERRSARPRGRGMGPDGGRRAPAGHRNPGRRRADPDPGLRRAGSGCTGGRGHAALESLDPDRSVCEDAVGGSLGPGRRAPRGIRHSRPGPRAGRGGRPCGAIRRLRSSLGGSRLARPLTSPGFATSAVANPGVHVTRPYAARLRYSW